MVFKNPGNFLNSGSKVSNFLAGAASLYSSLLNYTKLCASTRQIQPKKVENTELPLSISHSFCHHWGAGSMEKAAGHDLLEKSCFKNMEGDFY